MQCAKTHRTGHWKQAWCVAPQHGGPATAHGHAYHTPSTWHAKLWYTWSLSLKNPSSSSRGDPGNTREGPKQSVVLQVCSHRGPETGGGVRREEGILRGTPRR